MTTPMSTKAVISKALPMAIMISRSNISHNTWAEKCKPWVWVWTPAPPLPPSHLATTVCFLQRGDREPKPQSLPYAWKHESSQKPSIPKWSRLGKGFIHGWKRTESPEGTQSTETLRRIFSLSQEVTCNSPSKTSLHLSKGFYSQTPGSQEITFTDKSQDWTLAIQQISILFYGNDSGKDFFSKHYAV